MIAWNDNWIKQQQAKYAQRVQAAGIHLKNEARILISIPSRTVSVVEAKNGKTKKVLGPRGSNRSKPGEPPHLDRGNLRRSVADDFNADQLLSRVGSASKVARWTEFGTSKMAVRPWLRRSLKENHEAIRQIITHGGTSNVSVS
jgi:hypothetical protein